LPFSSRADVEVATVASGGAAPALTVTGHVLRADQLQEINRDIIGTGDVYVLCRNATVPVVLTTWTLLGLAFSSVPQSGKGASAIVTPIILSSPRHQKIL
jgi:hypothetical protein